MSSLALRARGVRIIVGSMDRMAYVAAIFTMAGLVKGLLGLGLPTVGMGLLALIMPPVQAAAILTLPSFVTNVWQMVGGPSLRAIVKLIWPMMLGICAGTWAGAGFMSGQYERGGTIALGLALAAYGAISLWGVGVPASRAAEAWVSPLIGLFTGLIAAATGVFTIPAVPYLEALGFAKEQLVQALGLSFTVSTLALAVNIARAGAFGAAGGVNAMVALACSIAGMLVGQALRQRMRPDVFRLWFLVGLLALGLYIAAHAAA